MKSQYKRYHKRAYVKIFIIFISFFMLYSCASTQRSYYSQKENYIGVTGVIDHIKYNDDLSALYIGVSEMSPVLDDNCFKIVGGNMEIVKGNGIDNTIKIGDKIDLVTAPKYFGDGYVFPIVSLSVNGTVILEFDEGLKNYLEWLEHN